MRQGLSSSSPSLSLPLSLSLSLLARRALDLILSLPPRPAFFVSDNFASIRDGAKDGSKDSTFLRSFIGWVRDCDFLDHTRSRRRGDVDIDSRGRVSLHFGSIIRGIQLVIRSFVAAYISPSTRAWGKNLHNFTLTLTLTLL